MLVIGDFSYDVVGLFSSPEGIMGTFFIILGLIMLTSDGEDKE